MNLATLAIDELIVHDVPLHRVGASDNDDLVLSEIPSFLDAVVTNLFTERIKRSLSRNHFDVERDPGSTSPVPELVEALIAAAPAQTESVLVDTSQKMAQHLFSTQTGSNPPGLLIVCRTRVDGAPSATIMKLEREDAMHIRLASAGQKRTFGMDYLRDLMLGKNTKVFKAALFGLEAGALDGIVSDGQKSETNAEVANFFLHRFLGARLKTAPDVATKALFNSTQAFINTLPDPEKQARYEIALIATMNAPSKTVRFSNIASQFDTTDRKPYENHLLTAEVPTGKFDKDLRLISAHLKQMVFGFKKSKLRLSGPADDVKEFVRFKKAKGTTEIQDEVKDVRGGSR